MIPPHVRFWGYSGHQFDVPPCPLLTQSGHWRSKFAVMHNAAVSMVKYSPLLGGAAYEAARVHRTDRWRGGVAAG
jgi:hypothetical protein